MEQIKKYIKLIQVIILVIALGILGGFLYSKYLGVYPKKITCGVYSFNRTYCAPSKRWAYSCQTYVDSTECTRKW